MRNYKKKTNFRPLTEDILIQARALMEKGMSIRQAAKVIGFNESTLRAKVKRGKASQQLGRYRTVFSECQEKELMKLCVELGKSSSGLTVKSLRTLLYDYATKNNIPNRFSLETRLAGRDFTREFMKRHRLSTRSLPRKPDAQAVVKSSKTVSFLTEHYFENFEKLMHKHAFPPDRIYIMNATSVECSRSYQNNKASLKKLGSDKSVVIEQKSFCSIICSVNAVGQNVPPFFIFPQDIPESQFTQSAPAGSDMEVSESGNVDSVASLKWMNHFQHFTNSCREKPILLILNKYIADISLEEFTYAGLHGIYLFLIPPNVPHKTLPLYKHINKHLEAGNTAATELIDTDIEPSHSDIIAIFEIFKTAYEKATTVEDAIKGFRDVGITPPDREKFCQFTTEDTDTENNEDEDERRLIVFDCYDGVPVETVLTVWGETEEHSDEQSSDGNMCTSASNCDPTVAGPSK